MSESGNPPYKFIDLNVWPRPHIHAVGQITVEWNQAERELDELLILYLETDRPTGKLIVGTLGNRDKESFLRSLIETKEPSEKMCEAIKHAIRSYKICRDNRNHIAHSSAHPAPEKHKISFRKPRRTRPTEDHEMILEINQVRECANEIVRLRIYLMEIRKAASFLLMTRQMTSFSFGDEPPAENVDNPSLPEKPALPRQLNHLLGIVPDIDQSPPQS